GKSGLISMVVRRTGPIGLVTTENEKLTGVEVRPDGLVRVERETGWAVVDPGDVVAAVGGRGPQAPAGGDVPVGGRPSGARGPPNAGCGVIACLQNRPRCPVLSLAWDGCAPSVHFRLAVSKSVGVGCGCQRGPLSPLAAPSKLTSGRNRRLAPVLSGGQRQRP